MRTVFGKTKLEMTKTIYITYTREYIYVECIYVCVRATTGKIFARLR